MFTVTNNLSIPMRTGTMNTTSTNTTHHGMERSLTPMRISTNQSCMRIRIILTCTTGTITERCRTH